MLKKLSSGPYLIWMILFIVVPLLLVLFYGVTVEENGTYHFSLSNFKRLADPIYLKVFWRSIVLALQSTGLCLLLGYPMAMILSRMRPKYRTFAVMMFVMPMWMNFLLRTYAWMTILGRNGVINSILGFFGIAPIKMLFSEGAVLLGMVYNFLPFMVLPIYTVLSKMDRSLIEAAEDLGADKMTTFRRVTLPLSLPGIVSGVSMVFMPAVSTFVISTLLYGGQYMLVGNLIEQQFFATYDYHFGTVVSLVLMVLILVSMALLNRLSNVAGTEKEVNLW